MLTLCLFREASCGYEWGPCPKIQLRSTISPAQYAGKWYEHARDKTVFYETGDCVQAKYTLQSDNSLEVRNSQRAPGTNVPSDDSKLIGKNACPKGTGDCFVSFYWFDKNDYSIVDTDYTSYSIVRGCESYLFGLFRQEVFWILVRDPNAGALITNSA